MLNLLVVIAVIAFIFSAIAKGGKKGSKAGKAQTPIKGKRILTMNEQPMFLKLKEALPEHIVLAQVAFSALVTTTGQATRNRFNRKVADFVVLDKSFNVIAVVELDDSSHIGREDKDAERDLILKEAGIPVVRYPRTPDLNKIKTDFGIEPTITIPSIQRESKTKLVSDGFVIQVEKSDQET